MGSLTRYFARRALLFVPMALALATLLFLLVEAVPGSPGDIFIHPGMTAEMQAQVRTNLGLDAPLPQRYLSWLTSLARGDLGWSWSYGAPVTQVITRVLPNTLLLAGVSLLLAFAAGTVIGVVQATRQNSPLDAALNLGVLTFYSVPSFWLGILLLLGFSVAGELVWGWSLGLPISGVVSVDHDLLSPWEQVVDRARHLVLPATTLVLVLAAGVARYARAGMLEVIRSEYVTAARARGLSAGRVLWRHAFPNAALPLITVFGLYVPVLFSGAVFVEAVFAWPGMGLLMVQAISSRDYPLVLAGGLLFGLLVLVGNLVADALYAVADPRIRYGTAER